MHRKKFNFRYAANTDSNHKEIVNGLRQAHRSVVNTHRVGGDFPDLVVGFRGKTYLLEIKAGDGELSAGQRRFIELWRGGTVALVRNLEEALRVTES